MQAEPTAPARFDTGCFVRDHLASAGARSVRLLHGRKAPRRRRLRLGSSRAKGAVPGLGPPRRHLVDEPQTDRRIEEVLDSVERELDLVAPDIRQWAQRYFRNARPRYVKDLRTIERWYDSGEILEVGSLPYHLTMSLKMLGYENIGLDLDPDRASQLIDRHQLRVEKCDIEHDPFPFADESFGLVLLNEVFEHLRINPFYTLSEIVRVLAPAGRLILTTPNLYSLGTVLSYVRGKGFNNPLTEFRKLELLGHMGHIRVYSASEVRAFLEDVGLRVRAIEFRTYRRLRGWRRPVMDLVGRFAPQFGAYIVCVAEKPISGKSSLDIRLPDTYQGMSSSPRPPVGTERGWLRRTSWRRGLPGRVDTGRHEPVLGP